MCLRAGHVLPDTATNPRYGRPRHSVRVTGKQEGTKLLLVCGQFTRSAAWLPEIHSILEKNLTAGKAKPMQCSLLVAKHGKAALRRVLRSFVLNDVQISARSQRIRAHPAILRVARRIQS